MREITDREADLLIALASDQLTRHESRWLVLLTYLAQRSIPLGLAEAFTGDPLST